MTVTLRQESATGATTKGSALTYTELDNNFVHLLRQGSVTVRADSGTDQTLGEADKDSILNFVGGTNATTTISSDSAGETVITVAATDTGITDVVSDTTPQLGGDLDAQSNNITSLGTLNTHTIPGGTGTIALTSDITFTDVVDDTTPQLGGDLDVNGNSIVSVSNGNIAITPNGTGQVQTTNLQYDEDIHDLGTTSGTITPNVANGNVQTITLNGNLTLNAFTSPIAGQSLTLIIDTNGTGRTITTTMKTPDATDPTMSTTDTTDICTVFYDGTNYYMNYVTNFA